MASAKSLQGIKRHLFQGIAWSPRYHSRFRDMPPPIPINVELGNDECAWRCHKQYSVNFLIVSTHVLHP